MSRILGEAKRRSGKAVMYALLAALLLSLPVLGCAFPPSQEIKIEILPRCEGVWEPGIEDVIEF
jgi:hypothetical protein